MFEVRITHDFARRHCIWDWFEQESIIPKWSHEYQDNLPRGQSPLFVFQFSDRTSALLFKLTWGGQ
jgi:hypothetical protein